ncbi:MAG: aldehyde ferredoxin oxidoreductase family protein [Planctomycetota bacterium]
MASGGYHDQLLRFDLASGRARRSPIGDATLRAFLGGVGLGTRLLLEAGPPGLDPLDEQAVLVLALSPLVGSPLTTSAKFAVVAKSPLTDRIGDALAGDRFALGLKATGVDAVVLEGACQTPSLLVLDDESARLEDAAALRGLSLPEREARVLDRLGPGFSFFGIGPAGERLVRYATISGNGRHAGRGGLGAVLGSKRLLGLAVRGSKPTPLADPARVLALARDLSARSMGPATAKYRDLGTVANLLVFNRLGALPTHNFQALAFDGADRLSAEALAARPGHVRRHCAACGIGCEHRFPTRQGAGVRLEYEGLFALGPLCGIDDPETVIEAASRCDASGLDVISAGGTIAFAMECAARGLLEGVPAFGDGPGLLALLDDIAAPRGVGDLLAEGSRRPARRIGHGAERFACHVKGLELPGYEPRALQAMALGLAVNTRGADHNRSGAYEEDFRAGADRFRAEEGKARAVAASEDRAALLDSLILCKFLRGVFDDLPAETAELLAAVTGWDSDAGELAETAERIVTLRRLYNEREGWTRAEDTLPPRFLTESLPQGPAAGASLSAEDLDRMIAGYYRTRGWGSDGQVSRDRLEALGLGDLATPRPLPSPAEEPA